MGAPTLPRRSRSGEELEHFALPGQAPPVARGRLEHEIVEPSPSVVEIAPVARAVVPEPQPVSTPDVPAPKRRRLALATVAACVLAASGGLAAVALGAHHAPTASRPGQVRDPVTVADPVDMFASPVPLGDREEYVRTRLLPSGAVEVTHWIHSDTPLTRVRVGVPHVPGLSAHHLSMGQVEVTADGTRVEAHPAGPHRSFHVTLPRAHDLSVSYRLSGVLQRSGSASGRALVRVTALDVDVNVPMGRETRQVMGDVLSLACSGNGPHGLPEPCGTTEHGSWVTVLHGRATHDTVMAQVDLG